MTNILVIILAFVAAMLGIVQESRATGTEETIYGLTHLGFGMAAVAGLGMIVGIIQLIAAQKKERDDRAQVRAIARDVRSLVEKAADSETRVVLTKISESLEAVGASIKNSDFSSADLSGSSFRSVRVADADFAGSLFDRSNFEKSTFRGCDFDHCTLDDSRLTNCAFGKADLSGSDLSRIKFDKLTRFPGA